jgi:NAD(P)-dependent dehydrogenase (short-subunit alcohol dehydrogenase family)
MKLEGKVALITGGGSGIGAAVTKRYVEEGARVCITGRRKKALEAVAANFPAGTVATYSGDVSQEDDVIGMVDATVKFGGKLDILVNNAGISTSTPIAELEMADWNRTIAINLTGPYLVMKAAIPHLIAAGGGSIINISSVGGTRCLPGMPAYCASKAGLIMLSQQVALDYGTRNIRCNVVCPGGVKTAMTENEFGQIGKQIGMEPDRFFSLISTEMPLKRFADTDEMGGICVFLANDDSSFMTGSCLIIDGGTAIVDVVGAGITGALRRAGLPAQ